MNTDQTATEAPPILTAEGQTVWVVTPKACAELFDLLEDGPIGESKIVNWFAELRLATFYDDPAQA